jgi:serine/threonine-protein kinase
MRIELERLDDTRHREPFVLTRPGLYLIGRSQQCHFRIGEDPTASRFHLLLERTPLCCRLRDLRGKNGTLVNGRAVRTCLLNHGDEIAVGNTRLRACFDVPPDRVPAPTGTSAEPAAPGGSRLAPTPSDRREPPQIPGYRILGDLAETIHGHLWIGQHEKGRRSVVIRSIDASALSDDASELFLRRSSTIAALRHPAVVSELDAGRSGACLYVVSEHVLGMDSEKWFRANAGSSEAERVRRIGLAALDALECAHSHGVVHGDVRPANILISNKRADDFSVGITDFGLAARCRDAGLTYLTEPGHIHDLLPFMAPEQILDGGGCDHRADLFSLAATLCRLLFGESPYLFRAGEDPFVTVAGARIAPVKGAAGAPPELTRVLERALARDPEHRYRSAADMRDELLAVP